MTRRSGGSGWTTRSTLGPVLVIDPPEGFEDDDDDDDDFAVATDRFAPLRAEHDELRARLATLRSLAADDASRAGVWEAIVVALEAHAEAEEEVVYRRLAGVGGVSRMAQGAKLAHTRMKSLAKRIELTPPDDPEYVDQLDELERVSRHHVELEEHFLVPLADVALGRDEVDAMVAGYVRRRLEILRGRGAG